MAGAGTPFILVWAWTFPAFADGLTETDLAPSPILERDTARTSGACRQYSCPGLAPTAEGAPCVIDDAETRYVVREGYADAYSANMREINTNTRSFFNTAEMEIPEGFILPERVRVNGIRTAFRGRTHYDSATGRNVASEIHDVQFVQDSATGRVFELQVTIESPPGNAASRLTRIFWDPRLGFRDPETSALIGAAELPGETLAEKGAAFDALVGRYLGRARECPFVKEHLTARLHEDDPASAVVDQFFEPCSSTPDLCPAARLGAAAPLADGQAAAIDPVVGALENGGADLSSATHDVNHRFNLELIHSVRMGLLNTQAQIFTYVVDSSGGRDYGLGNYDSDAITRHGGLPDMEPLCNVSSGGANYRFNETYRDAIGEHHRELADSSEDARALRRNLTGRATRRLLVDLVKAAFYRCQAAVEPLGPTISNQRIAELLDANPELKLMGTDWAERLFGMMRDQLPERGSQFDFSAYSTDNRYCLTDDAMAAHHRLVRAIESEDLGLISRGFRWNVERARFHALDRLRAYQQQVTGQCRSAETEWDPTWVPGWLGGDDDGVPLWRDRRVVEDVVRRYANASPPRTVELRRFREVMCANRARQSDADDTKFWINLGIDGGLLVLTLATGGAGGTVGIAARAAIATADIVVAGAQASDMVDEAGDALAHQRLLSAAGFASEADVEAAASTLANAYWISGIVAAGSIIGVTDLLPLARAAFVADGAGGFAKAAGTDEIVRAITGTGGRRIPREVLDQATLACSDGDCALGHSVLRLWASRGESAEAALRSFEADDWTAFSHYADLEADLARRSRRAFENGDLRLHEYLRDRLSTARGQVRDFFEHWGAACVRR